MIETGAGNLKRVSKHSSQVALHSFFYIKSLYHIPRSVPVEKQN